MSKTAASTTMPPEYFSVGMDVLSEDALEVIEQLNWSACKRPVVHVSMNVGDDDYAGTNELGTLRLMFPTTAGWNTCLVFKIVVEPEVTSLTVGARCYVSAGTCDLRVTIGASAATTIGSFQLADNGTEKTCTINTSSSGVGELTVTIERNHSTGSAADCYIRNIRVEDNEITATDLSDPEDS